MEAEREREPRDRRDRWSHSILSRFLWLCLSLEQLWTFLFVLLHFPCPGWRWGFSSWSFWRSKVSKGDRHIHIPRISLFSAYKATHGHCALLISYPFPPPRVLLFTVFQHNRSFQRRQSFNVERKASLWREEDFMRTDITLLVVFFHHRILGLDFSDYGLCLDLSICLVICLYTNVSVDTPGCRVRLVIREDLGTTSVSVAV